MMKAEYILSLLICFALFSCNSESNQENKSSIINEVEKDSTVVLSTFNVGEERKVQTFEINASKKQEIKGAQGTIITFPVNCFGKEQGGIKIELIECYSIQDMLFNGLSTQTTDGELLESDGMIYLNALNEKGDTLEVKQGKVKVQMPTEQRKKDIQIFKGVENNNGIAWNLSKGILLSESDIISEKTKTENNSNEVENIPPKIENPEFNHQIKPKTEKGQIIVSENISNKNLVNYTFQITKMGWINCDRFIEGETQDLFVSIGEGQENVSLYLVLDKLNSNVMPRNPKAVNKQFEFRNIPVKESFTLVALATKGDEIYFGMANHTTHGGTVNCPELKSVTRQELTDLLMEKFGKNIWSRPLA